jgi:hypothetical protein
MLGVSKKNKQGGSMMRRIFGLFFGLLLLAGTVGNSTATTIDFTTATSNQIVFNYGLGQTVKVSAAAGYYNINGLNWFPYNILGLYRSTSGLGLKTGTSDSDFLLNGSGTYDERLIFTFSEKVTLTATGFSGATAVDNFDLTVGNTSILVDAVAVASYFYPSALINSINLSR